MARIASLTLALFLVHAPAALALAGGGSSGYSGGGGGGGGGGYSGGGGSYGGGGSGSADGPWWVWFVIIGGIVLFTVFSSAVGAAKYRARRRARVARVKTASAEAAQDDAYFAHDTVVAEAERLFREAQAAWDARDHARLEAMIPSELWEEWKRRLDDFERKGWHNRVEVKSVDAEYVGIVNRADDAQDRCVVRLEATVRDYVVDRHGQRIKRSDSTSEIATVAQYWTLGRHGDGWRLVSIEERAEGDHQLGAKLVTTPSEDERLRDQSLVEGAVAEAPPESVSTAEIADLDFDGDAQAAANDLSLADPRFAPDVLEAAARRAVAGWAEAVDGEDDQLAAVASPEALRELLYPNGQGTRLVVRGPKVERLRIVALDAAASPATMTVEVDVNGRRYVENRDTAAVVSGSRDAEAAFTERWTMALDGADDTPWRVVQAAGARAPA
ncbi:MAG TPA: TIM44-like domain-containing protein [Solirubrobacteraceae bacterium]|nr:TIM44-like domain-containing protein [Solirubrobacteraceae bacterium]